MKKKKGNFVSKIQEAAADYKRGQKEREEKAAKEEKGKKK